MALNDIVATWFGGRTSTGTLEIRPLTRVDTSTSSAPVDGLANRITFASSRTFSTMAAARRPGGGVGASHGARFGETMSDLNHHHHPGGTPVVFRCPNGCIHLLWGQTMLHFMVTEDAVDIAARRN